MKSKFIVFLVLGYFLAIFSSCGLKEHEVIVPIDADTVKTTVALNLILDTIYVEIIDKVIIDVNNEEVQNIYIQIDENTPIETVVLTFDNAEGQEYSLLTGVGFNFLENQLIVTDETFLDYEVNKEVVLTAKVTIGTEIKEFKIIVGLLDVVDITELIAHFNFDNQTLQDMATGKELISYNSVSYEQLGIHDNYYVNLSGEDEVLILDESTIDLNEDYSICFFANHQLKSGVITESIVCGYDDLGNQIIRIYFEDGKLNIDLQGDNRSELEYDFFTPSKVTLARVAFVKNGNLYSLLVNNNNLEQELLDDTDLVIPTISYWSLGAERSQVGIISNELSGKIDNIRFYQKAISDSDYESIISVDY